MKDIKFKKKDNVLHRTWKARSASHWMLGHPVISTHFSPLWCTMSIMIGSQVWIFVIYHLCNFLIVYIEELLIDFRELIGSHSGENMAFAVWDTLELYSLKGKVRTSFIIISGLRLTSYLFRCLLSIVIMPQTMTHFWNHWRGYMWMEVMILMLKRAVFTVCLIPSTWRHWRQVTRLLCM